MGLSLRNIGKKVWDQVNMFDNGRTASHAAPTNNRSIVGQLTHNGVTNTVGNFVGKPLVMNPVATTVVEPARMLSAFATKNNNAFQASQGRELTNFRQSLPYQIGAQGVNAGQAGINLAFKAPALDLMHRPVAAEAARTAGLREFNNTVVGQLTRPAQVGIANLGHANAAAQQEVGLDPHATGAQKYFADPLVGALGTLGFAKGAASLKRGPQEPTDIAVDAKRSVTSKVPVTVNKKIDVRQIPDRQELADRYNQHMALLSKKFGQAQVPLTTAGKKGRQGIFAEDSVYNDANYAAEKQKIQQAYENGTLSKPIKVQEGKTVTAKAEKPVVTPKDMAKIDSFAKQKNLSHQEQIQEAVLRDKAGLPPVTAKGAEPDLTGLEPASPYSSAPKAPGAFARSWQSVRGVISGHGAGGQRVADLLGMKRDASERGQEGFLRQIPTVQALKGKEFETFVDTLDRLSNGEKGVKVPKVIGEAVKEWRQAIPTIRDRAVKAGMDVGDLGPNYFPRQYKDLFKGDNAMRNLGQKLIDNGTAKNMGEAMNKLKLMRREYSRPFGNLEKTREFNLPGYDKTPEALTNYISRSFERIAHAEHFGPKNEVLEQLKTRMSKDGYDISPDETLDRYLKTAFNDVNKQTPGHKASSAVRTFNAFRSLGGAGISNATQLPVNTATIAGIGRTGKGIVKSISPKARDEAKSTGILLDHSISDLAQSQLGTKGKVASNIASPLFRTIERFNRQATGIVGKDFGNAMAKKASGGDATASRMLEKIGVKGEIGAKLTREQEIQAARGLVEAAQFKVDPMDVPRWMDSPIGKLVAQFRTFQYKQTDFMYNYVIKEAFHGNFLPLTRFIATGVPAGTAALAVRGAMKGNNQLDLSGDSTPEQKGLGIAGKALSQVGGPGLVGGSILNMMDGAKYGNITGGAAGLVGGPTLSLGVETAQNIDKGKGSGDWSKLGKEGLRQIPTVGPYASNKVFPKKDQPSTGGNKPTKDLTVEELNNRSKKEIEDFKKQMKPDGSGLNKLSDGRYIYQVGNRYETATDLKKAREAVAKDGFDKSGASSKTVGDRYYYRNENDEVKSMPKYKHEYDLVDSKTSYDMDVAKDAEDYGAWTDSATKKLKGLETLRDHYNKDSQADKVDDTNKKIFDLKKQMAKYASYGGAFSKGGGSGGGGGTRTKSAGSPFEYAVSSTSGSAAAKKPSVASRRSSGAVTARAYRSSKPKVTLKKSRI